MNFFRKLFPLTQRKSRAAYSNENGLSKETKDKLNVDQSYLLPDTVDNSNTLASNVFSDDEDLVTFNDSSATSTILTEEKDSNMILDELETVVPNQNSLESVCIKDPEEIKVNILEDTGNVNNTTKTTDPAIKVAIGNVNRSHKEIKDMPNEVSDNFGSYNNLKQYTELSAVDDEILQKLNKTMVPKEIGHINDVSTDDTKIVDDETLKNLQEFEDTLNNFDKTACLSDDVINLDEFNEIFDNLAAENGDFLLQVGPGRNIQEYNENRLDRERKTLQDNNICISNILENIDVISISSSEELITQIDLTQNSVVNEIQNSINSNVNGIQNSLNSNLNETQYSINSNVNEIQKSLNSNVNETQYSINSNVNEIQNSINSNMNETQNSNDDGYNSSDFEFISETEAKMDGFIINFNRKDYRAQDNASPASSEPLSHYKERRKETNGHDIEAFDPGEGSSGMNRVRTQYEDRSYRNDHRIPEGEDYLGLFQGIFNPILPACEIYFMENKSVRTSAMNIQYDGIGFDKQLALRRPQPDSSEEEFEDEAKECAKKILKMYPGENRKRRRRH